MKEKLKAIEKKLMKFELDEIRENKDIENKEESSQSETNKR
jgi:hypothetical protein